VRLRPTAMEREKCVRRKFSATFRIVLFSMLLGAFGVPLGAQTTDPTYLFLLEGKGVPTGTIHSFSLNTSTGALTEVPGSPFSAGLGPEQMAADPTGRFLYVANQNSKDITAFSIDPGTGSLSLIPGSPFFLGAEPVTMGTDPTGRFLYVFAGIFANDFSQEQLFEYDIDSVSGALTLTTSPPTIWEPRPGTLITSIVFNAIGSMAYLGRTASAGQQGPISICTVDFTTGALAQVASVQPASPQADHLAMASAGNFLFSTSAQNEQVDAFAIAAAGGLTEISGSPYPAQNLNFPVGALVHSSGNFLYVVNENQPYQTTLPTSQYAGSIFAFGINAATGSLSPLQGSPFPAGINASSIGIDPTGSFAFVPSTNYVTGTYKGFAQILGYSIDPSSGALSPFQAPAWTDSVQSTGSQLVISGAASVVANPTPAITSLSPSSVTASGLGFTLQINGTGFVSSSRAYVGGQPRATTFVSSTQLNANIPASDIANEGTAVVFVFNPLPGGGASTSAELTVTSPAPTITLVSPTSIVVGTVGGGVTIIGSNFLTSSIVNFNGSALTTLYVSTTAIRGLIPSSDLGTVGTATITVTNPSNGGVGGGTSNALTISIVAPSPKFAVTGISPTSAQAGAPAFTLTVSGTAFIAPSSGSPGSQVSFGLASVPTTYVSSTQLTAAIPASAIAISGNPYVIVTNPDGSTSTPITFTVNNPAPAGGSITPPSLPAGSNALTLNVTGTGFEPSSIVLVNGSPRPTTYVSSTLLHVALLSSDIAQGGTLNITVFTPPPGGGTSEAMNLPIVNPQPGSISISPASVTVGSGAQVLGVAGTSFVTNSNVAINGSPRVTKFEGSTALQVTLAPGDVGQTGTLNVTVVNPPPGGGISATTGLAVVNPLPGLISVSPPTFVAGSGSSTVFITGTGFVAASVVLVNSSPRIPSTVGQNSLELALLASDLAHGGTLNIGVSNPPPGGGLSPAVQITVEEDSLISPGSNTATITAGDPASIPLTFSSSTGTVSNPVHFAVTAVTPHAVGMASSFRPSATMASGASPLSVLLSVTTQAGANTSWVNLPQGLLHGWPGVWLLAFALVSAGILLLGTSGRFARLAPQFLLLLLLCGLASLAACAGVGSGSSSTSPSNPPTGTRPGTYTITVTATSAGVAHNIPVTLQVM
jgi:6-phosphogluconolactonase (cycloisomerase 2 family)